MSNPKENRPSLDSTDVAIARWLWRVSIAAKDSTARRAISWAAGAIVRGEHVVPNQGNVPIDLFEGRVG